MTYTEKALNIKSLGKKDGKYYFSHKRGFTFYVVKTSQGWLMEIDPQGALAGHGHTKWDAMVDGIRNWTKR